MKTIVLISLFIAIGNFSFCQQDEITIVDSAGYNVKLRFLDDEHALLIYDDDGGYKGHLLLTHTTSNDTILLIDSWNKIEVSIDTEYSYNEDVGDGLIMLQTVFLHHYEEGFMMTEGFEYEYPCAKSSPSDSNDYQHTVVDPCNLTNFLLIIHRRNEDEINIKIEIPEGLNHVKIYWTGVFSTFFYPITEYCSFPIRKSINDEMKVIVFRWE